VSAIDRALFGLELTGFVNPLEGENAAADDAKNIKREGT
jgi:hypothetical protein